MQRYIVNRLLQAVGTLLVVAVLVFVVARLAGTPVDAFVPVDATD